MLTGWNSQQPRDMEACCNEASEWWGNASVADQEMASRTPSAAPVFRFTTCSAVLWTEILLFTSLLVLNEHSSQKQMGGHWEHSNRRLSCPSADTMLRSPAESWALRDVHFTCLDFWCCWCCFGLLLDCRFQSYFSCSEEMIKKGFPHLFSWHPSAPKKECVLCSAACDALIMHKSSWTGPPVSFINFDLFSHYKDGLVNI